MFISGTNPQYTNSQRIRKDRQTEIAENTTHVQNNTVQHISNCMVAANDAEDVHVDTAYGKDDGHSSLSNLTATCVGNGRPVGNRAELGVISGKNKPIKQKPETSFFQCFTLVVWAHSAAKNVLQRCQRKHTKDKGKGNVDLYSAYTWNISKALNASMHRCIRDFLLIRYINLRLLTYLLTQI